MKQFHQTSHGSTAGRLRESEDENKTMRFLLSQACSLVPVGEIN